MSEFASIAPCFLVADIRATMVWYEERLGFQGDPFPDSEPYVFAILRRENIEIMLQRLVNHQKPYLYPLRPGGVWDAYIRMARISEFYLSLRERVEIIEPLRQQPYGMWEFEVKDPNGYVLVFAEFVQ